MRNRLLVVGCAVVGIAAGAAAQNAIGDLESTDASVKGAVTLSAAGTRVLSGTNITAGESRASVRLARGGRLDICPRSALSISSSQSGRELMLALGTGAMETHYQLPASADTILTPDFRIMLAGPGKFEFAVAVDARGNTCVRSLPGNGASAIVYEQMGDGIYQVPPGSQVLFRDGTVRNPDTLIPGDCGCPPAQNLRAETEPKPMPSRPEEPARAGNPGEPALSRPPSPAPGELHVQVDAPFVFRGDAPTAPPPPIVAQLESRGLPPMLLAVPALPPAAPPAPPSKPPVQMAEAKPPSKGLFHRIKAMFGSIFH
jgi:hypothetical protein